MQEMSRSSRHDMPWLANIATVLALVGTTWWSSEQRPVAAPAQAAQQATVPAAAHATRVRNDGAAATGLQSSRAPAPPDEAVQASPGVVLAAWHAPESVVKLANPAALKQPVTVAAKVDGLASAGADH
jgi:hypothetical protein